MSLLKKIKKEVKVIFILMLAVTSIAFVQKKQSATTCHTIRINVINPESSNFVDEKEVARLITGDRSVALVGNSYGRINLKEIETRTKTNTYIQDAEAYKDHRGDIIVDAYIARPIARIMRTGKPDQYITDKGNLVETSTNYTSRVLLITGDYVSSFKQNLEQDSSQQVLFKFLEYIYNDPFWKAQIAQIDIDRDGEMVIYPQVTKQYIQFGTLDEWQEKMEKLKIFYDKILPFKGWNAYSRVNLVYENQIICE